MVWCRDLSFAIPSWKPIISKKFLILVKFMVVHLSCFASNILFRFAHMLTCNGCYTRWQLYTTGGRITTIGGM